MKSLIRVRMSAEDAHYGGNLVDGAHMVKLFGDVINDFTLLRSFSLIILTRYSKISTFVKHKKSKILLFQFG